MGLDKIVDPATNKVPFLTLYLFGPLVLVAVIVMIVLGTRRTADGPGPSEPFVSINSKQKIAGPLVFEKNIKTTPGNCFPYAGCTNPSTLANPVNLNTGKRDPAHVDDLVRCELAWRDCGAYQDCKDNKCVPKMSNDKIAYNAAFPYPLL